MFDDYVNNQEKIANRDGERDDEIFQSEVKQTKKWRNVEVDGEAPPGVQH